MATKVKIPERYRELYREALEIGPAHIAMTGYDYEITNLIKDVARVEARVEELENAGKEVLGAFKRGNFLRSYMQDLEKVVGPVNEWLTTHTERKKEYGGR